MRIGPNYQYGLSPIVQLFDYFEWKHCVMVTLDHTMMPFSEYGMPMDVKYTSDIRDRNDFVSSELRKKGKWMK